MRENVISVIGRNLNYWRHTQIDELRKSLVKRLQNLNKVYLNLSLLHTSDLKESNGKRNIVLKSFDDLSTNWSIDLSSILRKNGSLSPIIR